MKKRFVVLIICLCTVIGAAISVANAVTQTNTLISKSYLENTYRQELDVMITEQVSSALSAVQNNARQMLDSIGEDYLNLLAPPSEGNMEWLISGDFFAYSGAAGDTVTLNGGSGVIWRKGNATFDGVLVDVTNGKEVTDGSLAVNHRYIADGMVFITVTSESAAWSVEGEWLTSAEGQESPEPVDPPAPVDPVKTFSDVPATAWYYDAVCYVVERGLFQGTGDTVFSPGATMTRGMLTTVLYRMSGSPGISYSPIFSDVPENKWFTEGTVWAGQNEVVKGMGDGTFKPNGELTRAQIAQMLYNYAHWLGLDTSVRGDVSGFADASSISSWAREAMSWAVGIGLFQGDTQNRLTPSAAATRAQVATLLQRFDLWLFDTM